ncbi:MAG: hypothetical protein AB9872_09595 [Solidesulfovibrio sp.]
MTKREKILLAAMGVAAVVGLGVMFLGGDAPSKAPVANPQQAGVDTAKAQALLKTIQDASIGNAEKALLASIDRKWRVAAFYDKPLKGVAQTAATKLPRYSGYVELGSGRLAILDGLEYQAGDSLESGGYKIVSISQDQVVLEILANGNRVEVPYEGQDALAH